MKRLSLLAVAFSCLLGGGAFAAPQQNQTAQVNLTITTTHAVTLTWSASTSSGVTYNVYRSTISTGTYSVIASHLNALFYTERPGTNGAVSGTTYFYKLTAVDSNGIESDFTSVVSGKLP